MGHQQHIFRLFYHCQRFLGRNKIANKFNKKNFNWVCGSPPILYKLVLVPIPIVHTNFQDNLLTTLGISRHFKIIELILIGSVGHQQHIFRIFYHIKKNSNKFNLENLIGSVGHHQCYINCYSAPHPSYIQTFMRIR